MKELVYKFLDNYYYILGNDFLEYQNDELDCTLESVIENIKLIFSITQKQSKWYLKSWCGKQNRGFNFKLNYLNPKDWIFELIDKFVNDEIDTTDADWFSMLEPSKREIRIWRSFCNIIICLPNLNRIPKKIRKFGIEVEFKFNVLWSDVELTEFKNKCREELQHIIK